MFLLRRELRFAGQKSSFRTFFSQHKRSFHHSTRATWHTEPILRPQNCTNSTLHLSYILFSYISASETETCNLQANKLKRRRAESTCASINTWRERVQRCAHKPKRQWRAQFKFVALEFAKLCQFSCDMRVSHFRKLTLIPLFIYPRKPAATCLNLQAASTCNFQAFVCMALFLEKKKLDEWVQQSPKLHSDNELSKTNTTLLKLLLLLLLRQLILIQVSRESRSSGLADSKTNNVKVRQIKLALFALTLLAHYFALVSSRWLPSFFLAACHFRPLWPSRQEEASSSQLVLSPMLYPEIGRNACNLNRKFARRDHKNVLAGNKQKEKKCSARQTYILCLFVFVFVFVVMPQKSCCYLCEKGIVLFNDTYLAASSLELCIASRKALKSGQWASLQWQDLARSSWILSEVFCLFLYECLFRCCKSLLVFVVVSSSSLVG